MKTSRSWQTLFIFICFFFVCSGLFAQDEQQEQQEQQEQLKQQEQNQKKPGREYKPREQKLYIDIPLTIGEIALVNVIGNLSWRLWGPDKESAFITADSIRNNLDLKAWSFETGLGGDTFLVNQLFHPFAGALYFASARSNNFNFYWSMLFSTFGSFTWETFGETDPPAASDSINTVLGGIFLGEILHRLYIELDKGGTAGKIGASFLSLPDRLTAAVRGYGPDESPQKIRGSSLAVGFSWVNAMFFDDDTEITSWNAPSAFANLDLVYNDPYTANSMTPFDQFDLNISLTISPKRLYNYTFIADGYLTSWLIADDDADKASNGITLNLDNYITDSGFTEQNNGRENLSFNANSLDYAVKWLRRDRRIMDKPFDFSLKTHIGFLPWAITDYNGGIFRDDYNLYLLGGNIKLFMELRQVTEDDSKKNGHVLAFNLCFYDTWNIPNTPGFDVNMLFLSSKLAYSFPLTDRLSIYAADSFLLLYCHLTRDIGAEFPDITRWFNNAQLGLKISF